jgi:hypothetical protein
VGRERREISRVILHNLWGKRDLIWGKRDLTWGKRDLIWRAGIYEERDTG